MQSLGVLAERLARRLASPCPKCAAPSWPNGGAKWSDLQGVWRSNGHGRCRGVRMHRLCSSGSTTTQRRVEPGTGHLLSYVQSMTAHSSPPSAISTPRAGAGWS
ncbi:hypothetical protein [Methylobacterium sp. CM6257]